MQVLCVREYGHIAPIIGGVPRQESNAVRVTVEDFRLLKQMLLAGRERDDDTPYLFKLATYAGVEALQVQQYAGVILLPSGNCIEVLPKIFVADEAQSLTRSRAVLLKMLRALPDSPFRLFEKAALACGEMPLLEVFIACFLHEVGELIRRGICSDYQQEEGNRTFLRGKLLLREQIRHNAARRDRFYVQYDEFVPDRPENRLIKAALCRIAKISRDGENIRRCRIHLDAFGAIPPSTNIASDFAACRRDRNIAHYIPSLAWCRLLLQGQSPIPQAGQHQCLSVLFPMEVLFEKYVTRKLGEKATLAGWKMTAQARSEHLVELHDGSAHFMLKPDMLFSKPGARCAADTKWKIIRSRDDIKQSDLYQMFAYAEKYLRSEQHKRTFLIYPQTEQTPVSLAPFYFRKEGSELRVVPYDLDRDECSLTELI